MAIAHGGLPAEHACFYAQHMIEDLQELTADWWDIPLYMEWTPVSNFADTGERTGLVASVDPASLAQAPPLTVTALAFDGLASASTAAGEAGEACETLPLLPATASVKFYARMQGLPTNQLPYTKIISPAERAKFTREWMRHVTVQVRHGTYASNVHFLSIVYVGDARQQFNANLHLQLMFYPHARGLVYMSLVHSSTPTCTCN
jgi:hypothetical protein